MHVRALETRPAPPGPFTVHLAGQLRSAGPALLVVLALLAALALVLAPSVHASPAAASAAAAPASTQGSTQASNQTPTQAPARASTRARAETGPPLFTAWRTFTTADGLPSNTVFALAADGDTLWAGTEHGLARYRDGRWTAWQQADGLVYPVVTSLAVDPASGDLWIGTLGGVSRLSGGRFESYTQMTSGLANDVVYAIAVEGRYVWAATAAGASRFDTWNDRWEIFTNTNAPMHEIWCYGLAVAGDDLYMAVWGGGVLRWDHEHERWRDYRDPDGELELDLLRDDGPVSDVVASVSYGDGVLWAGTYFGVNRFDGRRWASFAKEDSPLVSNFVNFVRSEGTGAWLATDQGLVHTDGVTWTTYRRGATGAGTVTVVGPDGTERVVATDGTLPTNYVLGVVRRGDELWAATEDGLALGLPAHSARASAARSSQTDDRTGTDPPTGPTPDSAPGR